MLTLPGLAHQPDEKTILVRKTRTNTLFQQALALQVRAQNPHDVRQAMLSLCDAAHAGDHNAIRFVAAWLLDPDSPVYQPSAAAAWLHYMQGEQRQLLTCPLVTEDGLMNYMAKIPDMIDYYAKKEHVDAQLVRAVIEVESGFEPDATSAQGAAGLMQIMPQTALDQGLVDRFDTQSNIGAGTHYLATLLHRYKGVIRLALAAYNAGPATVDKCQCVPDIKETREYVIRIMEALHPRQQSSKKSAHLLSESKP